MKHLYSALILAIFITTGVQAQTNSYSFEKGDTFTATTVAEQEIVQTVMGNDQTVNSVTTSVENFEVVSMTGDTYTFSTMTASITTEVSTPMGAQTMSSDGDNANSGLKAMTGKSFTFTISDKGEILSFEGLDEMMSAVQTELAGSANAAMASQLTSQISEEAKRSSIGALFPVYPEDDASEWKKEQETVINGAPTSIKTTFSRTDSGDLKSRSDIEVKGEISQMGMKANLNLSGLMNSEFTINADTGLPTASSSLYDLAGFVMAQGMEIPMSISTNTTITVE